MPRVLLQRGPGLLVSRRDDARDSCSCPVTSPRRKALPWENAVSAEEAVKVLGTWAIGAQVCVPESLMRRPLNPPTSWRPCPGSGPAAGSFWGVSFRPGDVLDLDVGQMEALLAATTPASTLLPGGLGCRGNGRQAGALAPTPAQSSCYACTVALPRVNLNLDLFCDHSSCMCLSMWEVQGRPEQQAHTVPAPLPPHPHPASPCPSRCFLSPGAAETSETAERARLLDNALFAHAESVSSRFFGKDVYYRGIVEFSNASSHCHLLQGCRKGCACFVMGIL